MEVRPNGSSVRALLQFLIAAPAGGVISSGNRQSVGVCACAVVVVWRNFSVLGSARLGAFSLAAHAVGSGGGDCKSDANLSGGFVLFPRARKRRAKMMSARTLPLPTLYYSQPARKVMYSVRI